MFSVFYISAYSKRNGVSKVRSYSCVKIAPYYLKCCATKPYCREIFIAANLSSLHQWNPCMKLCQKRKCVDLVNCNLLWLLMLSLLKYFITIWMRSKLCVTFAQQIANYGTTRLSCGANNTTSPTTSFTDVCEFICCACWAHEKASIVSTKIWVWLVVF